MRNLLLVQTSDNVEDVIDASADRIQALKEEAQMVETEVLMRYIRVFSDLSNQIKYSSQKRVLIEIALIKLNKPAMDTDVSSLLNRMALIENKLENGVVAVSPTTTQSATPERQSQPKKKFDKAIPKDVQEVADNWGMVQKHLPTHFRAYFKDARFSVKGDNILLVVFKHGAVGYNQCNKPEVIEMLNTIISEQIKKEVTVEVQMLEDNQNFADVYQEVISRINMDIEEEDF